MLFVSPVPVSIVLYFLVELLEFFMLCAASFVDLF
jgi:hypothetical protein